ncbi:MAG: hypothetical protein AAB534_00665 [Patescibacteria group bacterium]
MQEVQPGLFAVEGEMPCNPEAIHTKPYSLVSTEGTPRHGEEIAVRILTFSQRLGRWVGVSWICLRDMAIEDHKTAFRIREAETRYGRAVRRHDFLCGVTRGFFSRLVKSPRIRKKDFFPEKLPATGIFQFPHCIDAGLGELTRGEMLVVKRGEKSMRQDIFFPTPALVSFILERQKKASTEDTRVMTR